MRRSLYRAKFVAGEGIRRYVQPDAFVAQQAQELCEQMITAVQDLPVGLQREEQLLIYNTIASWLHGETPNPAKLDLDPNSASPIRRSHRAALSILESAKSNLERNIDGPWLMEFVRYVDGWWESGLYEIDQDGSLRLWGTDNYLVYAFPALCLAASAASAHDVSLTSSDPLSDLMNKRKKVSELQHWIYWERRKWGGFYTLIFDSAGPSTARALLPGIEDQMGKTPYDERTWRWHVRLLLVLEDFDKAEKSLLRCLELPRCKAHSVHLPS